MDQALGQPYERLIGRYALYGEIASGGMATVHFGRLLGPVGFSRTVAIKRLHAQFAKDPEFVAMFLDEARLAGRIQHPNVVSTLDVVALEGELFLVMEYVQGESLAKLLGTMHRRNDQIPPRIVASILAGVLYGLHAAHEATDERGQPLHIVHRDVSPQNVIVGSDGASRVLDFGVAKAVGRVQSTREGEIKGKLAYMAPEQMKGGQMDRRSDIYGAAVVLWESLTARRLFDGEHAGVVFTKVMSGDVTAPSRLVPGVPRALDEIVLRGLDRDPERRYPTAREMAMDIEDRMGLASARQVGEWLAQIAGEALSKRAVRVKEIESVSTPPSMLLDSIPAAPSVPAFPPRSSPRASSPAFAPGLLPPPNPPPPPLHSPPYATPASTPPPPSYAPASRPSHASLPSLQAPYSSPAPDVAPSSSASSRSQVPSISVTSPSMLSPASANGRARVIAVAGGAAAVTVAAIVAIMLFRGDPSSPDAAAQTVSPASGASGAFATAVPSAEPTAAAPIAEPSDAVPAGSPEASAAAPAASSNASAASAPPPSPSSIPGSAPSAQPGRAPGAKTTAAGKPPAADCFPPYTLDANGIRRVKPQCL
jgi:eukaryotic-like serine/threonine-protein kinase